MMDWFIILLLIASIIHTEWRFRLLTHTTHEDARKVRDFFRGRISQIKMSETSHQAPEVDFQPRTTKRDTDDLPKTGRMSKVVNLSDGGDLHDPSSGANG